MTFTYNVIFQSDCGLIDIFFLCQIVKVQEKNQEHFIVISFTKAFDPVNRDVLCKVLKKLGISDTMLSISIS